MIVVYTADMERITFPGATRYCNDEHNNLEILTGSKGEDLVALFADNHWNRVLTEDEFEVEDDGEDQVEPGSAAENPVWGR